MATCALLEEDIKRDESLLDLSLRVDGDEVSRTSKSVACAEQRKLRGSLSLVCLLLCASQVGSVCALFHLLRLYADTRHSSADSADTTKLKIEANVIFVAAVKPMLPRLLRSFDPTTTDAATGSNALHDLLSRVLPASTDAFSYKLTEALVLHGVNIHQRNKQGRTVALSLAAAQVSSWAKSACGLHLLLQHGADINAQDNSGDTLLHHLICNKELRVLRDWIQCDVSNVSRLDLFVLNHAGHTPADLAALKHAQQPDSTDCSQVHRIVQAQTNLWRSCIRPALLSALSETMIPELANLTLGYVDGSGLSFEGDQVKHKVEQQEKQQAKA